MKKSLIIGGTSGIGRELSAILHSNNWQVTVLGRKQELLTEIYNQSNGQIAVLKHDIDEIDKTSEKLDKIFLEANEFDLVIVSAGISAINYELDWEIEKKIVDTNVAGIIKVYQYIYKRFAKQGYGHIVGITSISAIRGSRHYPAYSASKAFQANYLEALRCMAKHNNLPMKITDCQPGYVDTTMEKGGKLFWVIPAKKAASQIYNGILLKKKKVYISKRWRLVAWALKVAPRWLLEKV